jgi:hypothetical protein
MRRELVDQGIQYALFITCETYYSTQDNGANRTKGMAIVRTITCQDKRNVWKDNKVSRQ